MPTPSKKSSDSSNIQGEASDVIAKVKDLGLKCVTSLEHVNGVLSLLKYLKHDDDEVVFFAIKALQRTFLHYTKSGVMNCHLTREISSSESKRVKKDELGSVSKKLNEDVDDPLVKAGEWLRKQYKAFIKEAIILLDHEEPSIEIAVLETLMSFEQEDGKNRKNLEQQHFQNEIYSLVVARILYSANLPNDAFLTHFRTKFLWRFEDVRYYTLFNVYKLLVSRKETSHISFFSEPAFAKLELTELFLEQVEAHLKQEDANEVFTNKCMQLILDIPMPSKPSDLIHYLVPIPTIKREKEDTDNHKKRKLIATSTVGQMLKEVVEHRKIYSDCWIEFLKRELPITLFKQVLANMHDRVIPHLVTPIILLDFLGKCYDAGGICSVLALNSLFVLVTKHNVEYPQLYPKLYKLFTSDIFYTKYRVQFFELAHIFFRSTHVPTYLMCAFLKRMARLSLQAPPSGCIALIALMYTILFRHPESQSMIHRIPGMEQGQSERPIHILATKPEDYIKEDPFKEAEDDPALCHASESSLWEVKAMCMHYAPTVADLASLLFKSDHMRKENLTVEEYLGQSYQSMTQDQFFKAKAQTLSTEKPLSLF